jgi:putative flippase GtrA
MLSGVGRGPLPFAIPSHAGLIGDVGLRSLFTFGLVGAVGTACHYGTLILLVEVMHVGAVAATTAGFLVGMIVNYLLNYRHTFRSDKPHLEAAPKFMAIGVCTGVLNSLLVHAGVNVAGLNYLVVQVVTTGVLFLVNFVLNSLWTFRGSQRS